MTKSRTLVATAIAALSFAACADGSGEADIDDQSGEAMAAEQLATYEARLALGRQVYDDVCSECHSLNPPAKQAPPLTHIARHVREEYDTESAFTAHVISHIPDPSEERSVLPAHAIERFGLMPAQALTDEQLDGVAAWLWVMADSAQMGGGMGGEGMGGGMHGEGGMGGGEGRGMGGGQGRGMGGGMGGGMGSPPDTAGGHR